MNRQLILDKELLLKKSFETTALIAMEVLYFLLLIFVGANDKFTIVGIEMFLNMGMTCVICYALFVSKENARLVSNTEKVLYFPTTRRKYLQSKYTIILWFLLLQLMLTIITLGLADIVTNGNLNPNKMICSLLMVTVGILLPSGIAGLLIHISPYTIYPILLLCSPLMMLVFLISHTDSYLILFAILLATIFLWLSLLAISIIIYEKK